MTDNSEEQARVYMEADLKKFPDKVGSPTPNSSSLSVVFDTPIARPANVKDLANNSSNSRTGVPLAHPLQLMTLMVGENNWADLAVKTIGSSCSSTAPLFQVYSMAKGRNKEKQAERAIELITDKLMYPNLHQTGYELFLTTFENIATYGNAYWQIVRTKSGDIHSIYSLPPESIRIIPYLDKYGILHCAYHQIDMTMFGGQKNGDIYLEHEIIHFKETNEKSFLYGKPRLYSLMSHITANAQSLTAVNSWFEKGWSGGAIFKMDADDQVAARNREFLRENYGGAQNHGQMLLLEGSIQLVDNGQKYVGNLSFEKMSAVGRDAILTCMGVPVSMAGVRTDAGMGNAEIVASEEKSFKRSTIDRMHEIVFGKIQQKLIREFLGEKNIGIQAGTLSKFSLKEEIESVRALATLGITMRESRKILGVRALENDMINDVMLTITNNGVAKLEDIIGLDADGNKVETIFEKQMAQQKEIATQKSFGEMATPAKTNTSSGSPANKQIK